ncbi:MAG: dipeptidase [Bacteroidota bacterium]|nr:dipeptidase [Bacteroidota bacterium]
MEKILNKFIEENKERLLSELFELLRIPSISADPNYKNDMFKAAEYIKNKLVNAGADNVEVIPTDGHPVVYGEKIIDPELPTVLVYGHYDVQPADPIELWNTPAFEPTIKDDIIYGRGTCDDKGQLYIHVKAFEFMMKNNALTCNVKFMLEGEEEIGSPNLEIFVGKNKEKLKADVILVSDTDMIANNIPSINVGLRGLTYVQVEVTGPNRDLHSGMYGGAVANPINILCKMVSSLTDENNHITIPGFYEKVLELTNEERAEMGLTPFSLEEYMKELNIEDVCGEKGYTTLERTNIRPCLDLNGIWGGYTGEGAKTIIPSKAYAKISMRLVPHQENAEIAELFQKHFESIAPKSVKVKVTPLHGGQPYVSPTNIIEYIAASKAMEKTFGKKPIPTRSGGSIPIMALFEKELGIKSILLGFGLETDAIHSPNEHFGVFNYLKGIETVPYFFKYYSELKK